MGLNRLGRRQGAELVAKVTGGKALPAEVLEQILAHTDGVPLFVEELTKSVLESGLLREAGDRYVLDGPLPALAIPTTLRDSLIARLDRLAPVREIAQIGACIGREFSYELLAAVSPLSGEQLEEALEQLDQDRAGVPARHATGCHLHLQARPGAGRRLRLAAQEQARSAARPDRSGAGEGLLRASGERAGAARPSTSRRRANRARCPATGCKAGQRALARVALPEAVGHLTRP